MLQAVSAASQECMLDIVGVIVLQSQLLLFRAQVHARGALRPGRAFFPRGPGMNAPNSGPSLGARVVDASGTVGQCIDRRAN